MIYTKYLIVIAGPPCVGKSLLMRKLKNRELPSLEEKLQLGEISSWEFWADSKLDRILQLTTNKMIIHYNIFRPWKRKYLRYENQGYENDKVLKLLDIADKSTFVTLLEHPIVLLPRLKKRTRRVFCDLFNVFKFRKTLPRILRLRKTRCLYENPSKFWLQYSEWFDFCAKYKTKAHWIAKSTNLDSLQLCNESFDNPHFWNIS